MDPAVSDGLLTSAGERGAFLLLKPDDPKTPENQIDVVALDDEVAFAIECKSSGAHRQFVDFSATLAKHASMREGFTRAARTAFPSPHKRPAIFAIWSAGLILTDNDRARAADSAVALLELADLEYYEALVAQIGVAARFRFLADLLRGRGRSPVLSLLFRLFDESGWFHCLPLLAVVVAMTADALTEKTDQEQRTLGPRFLVPERTVTAFAAPAGRRNSKRMVVNPLGTLDKPLQDFP